MTVTLRTWYYASLTGGALHRVPVRFAEFSPRGELGRAGAPDPRWVAEDGGIRLVGALMVMADRAPVGVLGAARGYVPVFQGRRSEIVFSAKAFDEARRALAGELVHRARSSRSFAWPLSEYLLSRELALPMDVAEHIGEAAPWLFYDVWAPKVRRGRGGGEFFDLRSGVVRLGFRESV